MTYFFSIIKSSVLWSYARNRWQYDVLCVLILAFIFLTPKSWFENSELRFRQGHQSPVAQSLVLVSSENLSATPDRNEIERRVRDVTGRQDIKVSDVRAVQDVQGKIVAFEVDIR